MIDFGSLVGATKEIASYDLDALFSSLDVKGTHTEPRPAQREAMAELTARNGEKDLILKISTGAGKTTVGLLYLLGHMKLTKAPAVYLCPTVQLIEQVLEEAKKLGISAHEYPSGEPYPSPACMRGDSIIVCTYEKLFNARTTFNRAGIMPCAIVLDDAHAGVEIVRKQYTLSLQGDAYLELLDILDSSCGSYARTSWKDIKNGDPTRFLEIPHWIWSDHLKAIESALHNRREEQDFVFVWPYLQEILKYCRCVVNGTGAEIAPEVLPTHFVRSFAQARHRLYMSATLADDSLLTREFGASVSAATTPILPPSDRGLGERMILAPSLVDPTLDRQFIIELCVELAKLHNVVVLTSSGELAADWVAAGASYFVGENFAAGVNLLRKPESGLRFAVFSQRYDGVDLPDDACRVLVIDGIPYGAGLIDTQDQELSLMPGGVRNKTIFRIEQGMGRPVRSHADFAVVLLAGQELTTYVGRKDVLDAMTSDTRNQLQLSVEMAELIQKSNPDKPGIAVRTVIDQCLNRDPGWKNYYNTKVRDVAKNAVNIDQIKINLANEEREAHVQSMNNGAIDAKPRFHKAISTSGLGDQELGIYLQRLSRITYQFDPAEAIKLQQNARDYCLATSTPPAVPKKLIVSGAKTVAEKFLIWFNKFSSVNAAVLEAKRISEKLDLNAKHHHVEAAIQSLGEALGADSSRPENEYNEGPDNLWIWGDSMYVIEAKNENKTTLNKADSGQLHDSLQWACENYPLFADRLRPLTVAKVWQASKDAHYDPETRVLTQEGCDAIGLALVQLCLKMATTLPVLRVPATVHEEMINFKLSPEQFFGNYTKKIE